VCARAMEFALVFARETVCLPRAEEMTMRAGEREKDIEKERAKGSGREMKTEIRRGIQVRLA
jgi:penicillin V acylase-like amidase (Ntn superfamily)